jgi:hypothetical protein
MCAACTSAISLGHQTVRCSGGAPDGQSIPAPTAGTRYQLGEAIIRTGLPPDRLAEWHHRHREKGGQMLLEDSTGDDLALHCLARLSRVAILWFGDVQDDH